MQPDRRSIRATRRRRGAIFVELAFVILIAYVFFAYAIGYARVFMGAQIIQNAADIAARELSRLPLPANATFEEILDDPNNPDWAEFTENVYAEDFLVVNITPWRSGIFPGSLDDYLDAIEMPIVNKALVPLMFEREQGDAVFLRYPGAPAIGPSGGRTVIIPIIEPGATSMGGGRGPLGEETIVRWARVLEEVESPTSENPFQLSSPEAGMVQLRLNYPYQSANMFSFKTDPNGLAASRPNYADDGAVSPAPLPAGFILDPLVAPIGPDQDPYGGTYGLGGLEGLPFTTEEIFDGTKVSVRPWRRVLSAQSFHRREVFE